MKCPNCGAQSDGAFCANCGAPLSGAKCRDCQATLPTGARYCTSCGSAVARAGAQRNLPWVIAGVAVLALLAVTAWPSLRGANTAEPDGRVPLDQIQAEFGGTEPASGTPPALIGTPREQADRLFNRVMSERENGDTTRAKFFLPMAIQAYRIAGDLDADGYYHLSVLQSFAGHYADALASAEMILATSPNHLLGLAAAASAARAQGDIGAAREFYRRFLNAYETESKQARQEYQDHASILPELKAQAESFVQPR